MTSFAEILRKKGEDSNITNNHPIYRVIMYCSDTRKKEQWVMILKGSSVGCHIMKIEVLLTPIKTIQIPKFMLHSHGRK